MTLRFGDGLTPHDFDKFSDRKDHLKRISDVDEVMDDETLSDEEQKKKMEELGFTRYDDIEQSPEEELFFDIDMIQDDWNKNVFSELLQFKDHIISNAQRKNFMSIDRKPLPNYFADMKERKNKALQFLVCIDDMIYDCDENDILSPYSLNKNPALRKFLIAVWMFVLGVVKDRDTKEYLATIDGFLKENSVEIGSKRMTIITSTLNDYKS